MTIYRDVLDGYTPAEHRRALDRLAADIDSKCPKCEAGALTYEPPYRAEPDVGVLRAWRGGVSCDCCGYIAENEPREDL